MVYFWPNDYRLGGGKEERKWIAKASSSKEDVKPVQNVGISLCCLYWFFSLIRETEMPMAASSPCAGSESKVQLVFLCQDWNCQYSVPNLLLYD